MLEVFNLGDAEELINTKRFRIKLASRSGSEASAETEWGGWLGRYLAQQASAHDQAGMNKTTVQER